MPDLPGRFLLYQSQPLMQAAPIGNPLGWWHRFAQGVGEQDTSLHFWVWFELEPLVIHLLNLFGFELASWHAKQNPWAMIPKAEMPLLRKALRQSRLSTYSMSQQKLFPFKTQLSSQTCTPQKKCSAMGQCHVNSSHLNAFSITNQKLPLQDLREAPQLWRQSHAQWYPPCCFKFYAMKTCSYVMEILHGVQYQSMVCVCLFLL